MFEFHGWVNVNVDDRDDPEMDVLRSRQDSAIERIRSAISEIDDRSSHFDVRRLGNGLIVLMAHGLRNHRYQPVIDLLRWVAAELPNSRGFLHVLDDEDPRGIANSDRYEVWRLRDGRMTEQAEKDTEV